jgi:hypothetical protein
MYCFANFSVVQTVHAVCDRTCEEHSIAILVRCRDQISTVDSVLHIDAVDQELLLCRVLVRREDGVGGPLSRTKFCNSAILPVASVSDRRNA